MSTELQEKKQEPKTIRSLLESDAFKSQVSKALPKHLTPDRFIRICITAMTKTPKLAQCEQASLFNALLTLSQLGIEPDGRNAHLIPYENRKRGVTECQLIIDYKGIAELVMRSGLVSNLHCDVVCENDEFVYDRGELKKHLINFRQPRGKVFAVYALCRFKDGTEKCDVMTREEVEAIRSRSKAANVGPWVTDWTEMSKKTVFRRLSKMLPFSSEQRDAIESDDQQFHIDHTAIAASSSKSKADEMLERYNPRPPIESVAQSVDGPEFGTLAYVEKMLKSAKNIDELNDAMSLVSELSEDKQSALIEIYNQKEIGLKTNA